MPYGKGLRHEFHELARRDEQKEVRKKMGYARINANETNEQMNSNMMSLTYPVGTAGAWAWSPI
jgi:hypothetical protein